MTRRLRQVVDLYVVGMVAQLRDDTPVWVQPLNPFEQDTARNQAQIAKARITMAIREHGSDEQNKVKMFFLEEGLDAARAKLIDAKVAESMPKILDRLRSDPDWAERLQILERGLDDTARPIEEVERTMLEQLSKEYTDEVATRLESERDFLIDQYESAEESDLWRDYLDWYLDRRAAEIMMAEYRLHQIMYGVRECAGVLDGGVWDHTACRSHQVRIFDTKEEVLDVPEELQGLLMDTADQIEMTVREAKNVRRQESSSASSLLPSEAEASTASTPDEIPVAPPGTSASPSPTLSASSAGVS